MTDTPDTEPVQEVVEVDALTGEMTRRSFTDDELADRAELAQRPPIPTPADDDAV